VQSSWNTQRPKSSVRRCNRWKTAVFALALASCSTTFDNRGVVVAFRSPQYATAAFLSSWEPSPFIRRRGQRCTGSATLPLFSVSTKREDVEPETTIKTNVKQAPRKPRRRSIKKEAKTDVALLIDNTASHTAANDISTAITGNSTTDISELLLQDRPLMLDFVSGDNDLEKALSAKVSYFYLRRELGLSEDILWKITHDAPSVLGLTATNVRNKVQVLQMALDLSREETCMLIERQPTLLQLSANENLSPKLQWLTDALKLSSKQQLRQIILDQPGILTHALANLQIKLKFFTSNRGLGFSVDQCRTLLLQDARLWISSVKGGLLPRARFFIDELELPKDKLRIAILKNPRLLLYSVEDNLTPKLIQYGILTLHMDPKKHLVKLLTSYPQFVDYNLERVILPLSRYFLTELEYSAQEFRTILIRFPRIVTHSLTRKIKHAVGYLRYEVGLDADGVRRVLYQAPTVVGLDVSKNLRPKVEFLKDYLMGSIINSNDTEDHDTLEERQRVIRRVLVGLPSILNLNVDKLREKLEYLQEALRSEAQTKYAGLQESGVGGDAEDAHRRLLRETILKMPALLGYSLVKRTQPRMEQLIDAGLPPSSITIGITMKDADFQNWLHGRQKKKAKRAIVFVGTKGKEMLVPFSGSLTSNAKEQDKSGTENESDRSGRIVHWVRERNPPNT